MHDFNHDPEVQALLFNTKLGSQSLNLHTGGHRIIGCEMPVNMGTWLQVVGRVCRVGQVFDQVIYLLWVSDSYDQVLLHKLCRKFVSTFAGEGGVIGIDNNITEDAERVFQKFFGLKYSPYDLAWGNPNYTSKHTWINDSEERLLTNQTVAEVEDDNTELVTPMKQSRSRQVAPSTINKIGVARNTKVGEYGTNVLRNSTSDSPNEGMLAVLVQQRH